MKEKIRGFSLVELMVVIAIIGILSAVLLPNVTGVINKGKIAAATAEMNSLKTACLMYLDDNGNMPPGAGTAATWDVRTYSTSFAPYLDKPISTDPWKQTYYYNNCGYYYSWPYAVFIFSRGPNRTDDGTCWRPRWCCTAARGAATSYALTVGDDVGVYLRR